MVVKGAVCLSMLAILSLHIGDSVSVAQAGGTGVVARLSRSMVERGNRFAPNVVRIVVDRRLTQGDDEFFNLKTGPYTGVVVKDNGEILVCDTILGEFVGADKQGKNQTVRDIYVTLGDGTTYTATIVGRNRQYDLALLKIDAQGLAPIDLASMRAAKRGEGLSVISRSLTALRHGMTSGICSAQARERGLAFQIDARVGAAHLGALVVSHDNVPLGVVGQLDVRLVGQATGVAYAIGAETIVRALEGLRKGEFTPKPPQPFTGVVTARESANAIGLRVISVVAGSGAALAGIRVNDVLLQMDSHDLDSVATLERIIAGKNVGDQVKVSGTRADVDGETPFETVMTLRSRD